MKLVKLNDEVKKEVLKELSERSHSGNDDFTAVVDEILENVRANGDKAVFEYTKKFDSDAFTSRYRETLEAKNKEITKQATLDILSTVPLIIKSHIPTSIKNNKLLCLNVYISCLLTMLNHLTLPAKYEPALARQLEKSPAFNEEAFYARHLDDETILWSLDDSMLPLVKLIVKNTNDELISEIKSNISDAALSESEFNSIVASAMGAADETY